MLTPWPQWDEGENREGKSEKIMGWNKDNLIGQKRKNIMIIIIIMIKELKYKTQVMHNAVAHHSLVLSYFLSSSPLPAFLPVYILSKMSLDMEYPFDLFRSAILCVSSPSFFVPLQFSCCQGMRSWKVIFMVLQREKRLLLFSKYSHICYSILAG